MENKVENQYYPTNVTPPGESLAEILESIGMPQAELAERMGRPKKTINEIIKGKAAITPDTALQLERVLGTPASFWNNRERNYREWLARNDERQKLLVHLPWMRQFPLRSLIKFGWIEEHDDQINQLDELLRFFGVASPDQWQNLWQEPGIAYRQSPAFEANPAAVSAWLRKGELEAQKVECAPFDEERFRQVLQQARGLTNEPPEVFIPLLTQLCAQAGVVVVFVPELPGTFVCGVTRWLTPTKALIALSLRYKTDDHFWFTFFHEAGHVLLHGKRAIFLEAENGPQENGGRESEANQFSADWLIPPPAWAAFRPSGLHYSHEDIIVFARKQGIAPGIVVGRLQHDKRIPQRNSNGLKRKLSWDEFWKIL